MNDLNLNIQSKQLSRLISGLGLYSQDVEVKGICDDTRQLKSGDVFVCLPRAKHLESLIDQAIEQGAAAIIFVGQAPEKLEIISACLPDMQAVGLMLRRWFETDTTNIPCIGITGTDGKTSTAWMLREVLEKHLGSAWSCGTLGWMRDTEHLVDLGNTTPSLLTLHKLLAKAVQENVGALILEVSSHGIAQDRIAGIPFTAAIWTTMGHDHLEDHGGYAAYLKCKSDFIQQVAFAGGIVVANADYDSIAQALHGISGRIFWYASNKQADLLWLGKKKQVTFTDDREEVMLNQIPFADFHVENLAAVALLMKEVWGVSLSDFEHFDGLLSTPAGRLEPVGSLQNVWIDYAHTAEGLSRCLQSAKKLTRGDLLLVFGCGGNRDKAKRPEMGAVAAKYADACWLTSDNPRDEEQADIVADVLRGMKQQGLRKINVIEDRKIAIEQAVAQLGKKDKLVIAGKGHESYMEIRGKRLPWSDKETALAALRANGEQACA